MECCAAFCVWHTAVRRAHGHVFWSSQHPSSAKLFSKTPAFGAPLLFELFFVLLMIWIYHLVSLTRNRVHTLQTAEQERRVRALWREATSLQLRQRERSSNGDGKAGVSAEALNAIGRKFDEILNAICDLSDQLGEKGECYTVWFTLAILFMQTRRIWCHGLKFIPWSHRRECRLTVLAVFEDESVATPTYRDDSAARERLSKTPKFYLFVPPVLARH